MHTVCEENMCAGCMACLEICPHNAIKIKDEMKFYNAIIDDLNCINCGACYNVCQYNHQPVLHKPIVWYQGWVDDEKVRVNGSSGGLGTALLTSFIEKYGTACSCVYRDGNFQYEFANSVQDITKFSGSKYVKSNPFGVYKIMKNKLQNNEKVLFIGLPCQVAAVKKFVGDRLSEQLYTVDLICHGSPSPRLLEMFFEDHGTDLKTIREIRFRKKNKFCLCCTDSSLISEEVRDTYTIAFLNGLDYTENCYSCKYARYERTADITIGDSWGSELDPNEKRKGISLILCQTKKGEKLIHEMDLHLENVDIKKAVKSNHQLNYPTPMHRNRDKFFDEIQKKAEFDKAVFKCIPEIYYKEKIKMILIKIKSILGRK